MAKSIVEVPVMSTAVLRGFAKMANLPQGDPASCGSITWAAVYGADLMSENPWNSRVGNAKTSRVIGEHWSWVKRPFRGKLPCGCPRTYRTPHFRGDDYRWFRRSGKKYYCPTFLNVIEHLWRHHALSTEDHSQWTLLQILDWLKWAEGCGEQEPIKRTRRAGFTLEDGIRARALGVLLLPSAWARSPMPSG